MPDKPSAEALRVAERVHRYCAVAAQRHTLEYPHEVDAAIANMIDAAFPPFPGIEHAAGKAASLIRSATSSFCIPSERQMRETIRQEFRTFRPEPPAPSGMAYQRLHDLVRQQRMELHAAGLISNEEYAELDCDHIAIARLESYDELKAREAALIEERDCLKAQYDAVVESLKEHADRAKRRGEEIARLTAERDEAVKALHEFGDAIFTRLRKDDKPRGSDLISSERQRQISEEGWNSSHDDAHDFGELLIAANAYISVVQMPDRAHDILAVNWPWEKSCFKPSPDPIRTLVKAGALIAAEIDRLARLRPEGTNYADQ
jgi:hypothetical protein